MKSNQNIQIDFFELLPIEISLEILKFLDIQSMFNVVLYHLLKSTNFSENDQLTTQEKTTQIIAKEKALRRKELLKTNIKGNPFFQFYKKEFFNKNKIIAHGNGSYFVFNDRAEMPLLMGEEASQLERGVGDDTSQALCPIANIPKVKQIAMGVDHLLFLTISGLYSAGVNRGQLGVEKIQESIFQKINFLHNIKIKKIVTSVSTSIVLGDNGQLYGCGINDANLLIDEQVKKKDTFEIVNLNIKEKIIDISAGNNFLVATDAVNQVYIWGGHILKQNYLKRTGNVGLIKIPEEFHLKKVFTGPTSTFLLGKMAEQICVYTFGNNLFCMLGVKDIPLTTLTILPLPKSILTNELGIKKIVAGECHTLLLCNDHHTIYVYGGQLAYTNSAIPPLKINIADNIHDVAIKGMHEIGVTTANKLYFYQLKEEKWQLKNTINLLQTIPPPSP